jgi:ubiquitin C-terminal hydrolase
MVLKVFAVLELNSQFDYKFLLASDSNAFIEFGEALSPEYVYDALRGLKRFDSMKGRQEDAEEFLGFLLDGLHEEFLAG